MHTNRNPVQPVLWRRHESACDVSRVRDDFSLISICRQDVWQNIVDQSHEAAHQWSECCEAVELKVVVTVRKH